MSKTPTNERIETLKAELAAASAEKRRDDEVRIHAELEAAIVATGYKPPRSNYCCRAGKRQAAERRAMERRR